MVDELEQKLVVSVPQTADNNAQMLITILESYYRLCKKTVDKQILISNQSLIDTLSLSVNDSRPQILLVLSKELNDAKKLAEITELRKNIALATESTEHSIPVIKWLLVVHSRLSKAFDTREPAQRREVEKSSLTISGVVSVCFQSVSGIENGDGKINCIIRCRENSIVNKWFSSNAGFDIIQMNVQLPDGTKQIFDFYPEEATNTEQQLPELPKYLDENIKIFNPDQCIITKEQLEKQPSSWFSMASLKFW